MMGKLRLFAVGVAQTAWRWYSGERWKRVWWHWLASGITNFTPSCCQAQINLSLFQVQSKQLRMGKAFRQRISISFVTSPQTVILQYQSTNGYTWRLLNNYSKKCSVFDEGVFRTECESHRTRRDAGWGRQQPLNLFVTVWPQSSLSSLSTNWWLRCWIVVDRPRRRNGDTLIPWLSSQMICYLWLWPDHYQWMMDVNCWVSSKKRY